MQFSNNISDSEGLRRAYETPDGFYEIDGTVYISGTRNLEDIRHDWMKLPQGKVNQTKKIARCIGFHSTATWYRNVLSGIAWGLQLLKVLQKDGGLKAGHMAAPRIRYLVAKLPNSLPDTRGIGILSGF